MRPLMSAALAGAFDDRRVVLVDDDLLRAAELGQGDVFELLAEALEQGLAGGEDADVFEHGLAAIAVAGGLDGGDLERAAEAVDDQRGQGLAVDVLGDDQERLARVDDLLEHGDQVLDAGELLLVDEDVGVFEHALPSWSGSVTK